MLIIPFRNALANQPSPMSPCSAISRSDCAYSSSRDLGSGSARDVLRAQHIGKRADVLLRFGRLHYGGESPLCFPFEVELLLLPAQVPRYGLATHLCPSVFSHIVASMASSRPLNFVNFSDLAFSRITIG